MGKIINSNQEEFKEIVESESGLILVDFWAEWCGPCRMLGPVLEDVSDEIDNVTIIKVNVDENSELSSEYGVRSIPVVFFLKEGEQVDKFVGFKKKEEIISMIEKNTDEQED